MARVLIYSLVFPPDGVSTAQLMGELAEDLVAGGHEVSVITTQPHYNRDQVAEGAQPLRPKLGRLLLESDYRGIKVLHTTMPSDRNNWYDRLRGWIGFHIIGYAAGLRYVPKPDVIVVPSPLLTAALVAWAINRIRGGRYIYNVQELYPDLAVQMGRLRNPIALKSLRRIERFVYRSAGAVTGISRTICDRVVERGASQEKVHMIPNFVDIERLTPLPRENQFAREWCLGDDLIVSYAGNMGHAQGIETILEAAAQCSDTRIRFVLIGNGVLSERIAAEVRERQLANVLMISHQPYARMPDVYAASDVCLVPLRAHVGGSALPSKVFRIMACGRPVLALCDPASELADVVNGAEAGVVVPSGRPDLLLDAVNELAENSERRAEMGRAGRAFAERFYARDVITKKYCELVTALAGVRQQDVDATGSP
jgi:colanic acid biosynthesis glycosyl transferase WcaI